MEHALSALYDFVTGQTGLGDTLGRIVSVTAKSLGADMGGVTIVDQDGTAATVGYTEALVPEVEEAQYRTGVGPCLESVRSMAVVRTTELGDDPRWPEFGRAAAA